MALLRSSAPGLAASVPATAKRAASKIDGFMAGLSLRRRARRRIWSLSALITLHPPRHDHALPAADWERPDTGCEPFTCVRLRHRVVSREPTSLWRRS